MSVADKRLGDVDYRPLGAALKGHVGKPREAMIGRPPEPSGPRGTLSVIVAPLRRGLLARAPVIRR